MFAERVWCLRQLARTLRERHGVEAHVGDGAVKGPEFDAIKQRFCAGEFPVLCLSRIGHEGHNLQTASVLVHLDLPWLPGGLEQRVGRAARPGAARGYVQTYIPYIKGAGIEHVVSVLSPRGGEHHQILDSFEGVKAADSTVATQLGEITSEIADEQGPGRLRRHRRPTARRRRRLRALTRPASPLPSRATRSAQAVLNPPSIPGGAQWPTTRSYSSTPP